MAIQPQRVQMPPRRQLADTAIDGRFMQNDRMAPKEVFTFSLEVELDDLEATQRYNEQWEQEASEEPTVITPNEREQGSRASARLIAQAFTAQHQQTGLKLQSLRVLD